MNFVLHLNKYLLRHPNVDVGCRWFEKGKTDAVSGGN